MTFSPLMDLQLKHPDTALRLAILAKTQFCPI
jgi:hypothetical protein